VPFPLSILALGCERISYADQYFVQFSNGLRVSNLLVEIRMLLDLLKFLSEKSMHWKLKKKVGPEFAI